MVHNGFSGGITSPSSKAQARVINEAIEDAGITPAQVQYLEAHGTGTEFGDPMELGAAASIYGKGRTDEQPLLIGSVKANIGHLEAAGGSSGLIKTVLALNHGVIPMQIHCEEPSPHVPWHRLPLKIVSESTAWPDGEITIGGYNRPRFGRYKRASDRIIGRPTRNRSIGGAETAIQFDGFQRTRQKRATNSGNQVFGFFENQSVSESGRRLLYNSRRASSF